MRVKVWIRARVPRQSRCSIPDAAMVLRHHVTAKGQPGDRVVKSEDGPCTLDEIIRVLYWA